MWRYLAGGGALFLLLGGLVFLIWEMRATAVAVPEPPPFQSGSGASSEEVPPSADPVNKEARRFARYDKNDDGVVATSEFLASRQKAFARIDTNHDGAISFSEYAAKASEKFRKADQDRSGGLDPKEFATTKPVRKPKPVRPCPTANQPTKADVSEAEGDA